MLKVCFLLSLFILLNSSDCDPQKQDQRISSLEAEVKQLKDKVAELEQKQTATPEHHYELRNEGFRTFRFDPATGDTCIKLTSTADWKRKETMSQSCACTDASQQWLDMPKVNDQQQKAANNYFDVIVKPACGN
jgi:hypothetical protein